MIINEYYSSYFLLLFILISLLLTAIVLFLFLRAVPFFGHPCLFSLSLAGVCDCGAAVAEAGVAKPRDERDSRKAGPKDIAEADDVRWMSMAGFLGFLRRIMSH